MKGLVLAGGGARGSYQVGAYQALMELGWQPDIITGTSVGSLNGAMFALHKLDAAQELWKSLTPEGVMTLPASGGTGEDIRLIARDLVAKGGLDVQPLQAQVERIVDENALRASDIRFGLVTVEMLGLKAAELTVDEIPAGKLDDYLLASSACFPAFRPREIDGVKYIDGGYSDNMPFGLAQRMGATELVCVNLNGIGITRQNRTGLPTRVVESLWDLGGILEFAPERAAKNICLGYQDTLRVFGKMGGSLYAVKQEQDSFVQSFAAGWQALTGRVGAIAPAIGLALQAADKLGSAEGPLAPLENACRTLQVEPAHIYTPRELALAFRQAVGDEDMSIFACLAEKAEVALPELLRAAAEPVRLYRYLVARVLDTNMIL